MSFEEISLSDAAEFIVDNRGKTVPVQGSGFPLIATNCISNEDLYPEFSNVRYVSDEVYENWFRAHPEPDDIILTNKGSKNGAICLVPDPVSFCIAQDMVALRAKKGVVYPRYLFAVLRSSLVQNRIKELNVDSVIPHFKKTDFNKLFFSLPDYERQVVIGDCYYNYCQKIELNRQTNQTLEAIAQAIFKSWFVDFDPTRAKLKAKQNGQDPERAAMAAISGKTVEQLDQLSPEQQQQLKTTAALFPDALEDSELGEIPKGWEVVTADTLYDVTIGRTPPRKESHWFSNYLSDVPWVSIRDMGVSGTFIATTSEYVTSEAVNKHRMKLLPKGSIILSFKLTLGRVSILSIPMTTNEAIAHFVPSERFNHKYYIYFSFKTFNFNSLGSTSSIATAVNSKMIKKVPLLIPDAEILEKFESLIDPVMERVETGVAEINVSSELRDTLLPKLLSGKLRIPDTEKSLEEVGV